MTSRRPSRRELERELADLEGLPTEPIVDWATAEQLPRELWNNPAACWEYDLTEGASHPDLEPEGSGE